MPSIQILSALMAHLSKLKIMTICISTF